MPGIACQGNGPDALLDKKRFGDESAASAFYYGAFAVYVLMSFVKMATYQDVFFLSVDIFETYATGIIIAFLALKMFFQHARPSTWIMVLAIAAVGFVSWQYAAEGWLFWLFLFVLCGEGVSLYRLAAIALVVSVAMVAYTATCASLGLIENVIRYRPDGTVRYSMGFVHPNSFGVAMLMACTSLSVLRFGKHPAPSIAALVLAALLSISVADSRTPAVLAVLQICMLIVFHVVKTERGCAAWRKVFLAIIFGSLGVSLFFMFFYTPADPLFVALDTLLNGRFELAHAYYELGSISLLGNDYSSYPPIFYGVDGTVSQFVVDNAYCHIVLRYGLIPSVIFLAGFCALAIAVYRQQRWDALLFGLVIMSLYAIEETMGAMAESNYFLIAAASLVLFRTKSPDPLLELPTRERA